MCGGSSGTEGRLSALQLLTLRSLFPISASDGSNLKASPCHQQSMRMIYQCYSQLMAWLAVMIYLVDII